MVDCGSAAKKLALTLLLLLGAASAGCSSPADSTPKPAPTVSATARVRTNASFDATPTPSPSIVHIEFPAWVDDSLEMASSIVNADIIAKARFVSIDSATRRDGHGGYMAELIYKFEVVEYLKGDGADKLVIRMKSGPKYISFPDWLDERTESEALELEEYWLDRSMGLVGNWRDGILLVSRYRLTWEGGGYPNLGNIWLPEDKPSVYLHQFNEEKSFRISLSDLTARIEDMRPLMEGESASCLGGALYRRTRVRDQILGTYQELTIGGYQEPEPFPQHATVMDADESGYATVFRFRRPPYQAPRFSHYWLDGRDKDLFEIFVDTDHGATYESLRAVRPLPQGEYRVHYNQYHHSLPCDELPGNSEGPWWSRDTTEWVVNVTAPEGALQ